MERRRFVAMVTGALLAVPLTARAEPARIGLLAQDVQPGLLETFQAELQRRGYIEGRDIRIEVRNAGGHSDRLPALVDELLRLKVAVIVAVNTPAAQAAKKATATVPIVILRVADPVGQGLVGSLARPGGNVTGLAFMPDELGAKGVEMSRDRPEHHPGCLALQGGQSGRAAGRDGNRASQPPARASFRSSSRGRARRPSGGVPDGPPGPHRGDFRDGRRGDDEAAEAPARARRAPLAARRLDLQGL